MKKISDYIGSELFIIQKSIWKREFELRSGEELIAMMKYPKFFSDLAELTIQDGAFEFYSPKLFTRNTAVRKKGYQNPFAQYNSGFFGGKGILELPRGLRLNIRIGLFKKLAEAYLGENDLIFSILSRFSMKQRCEVLIEKRTEILDEYPWIIMLCFYLALQKKRNTAKG